MKETKKLSVSTKLNERHVELLDKLIQKGKVKTRAEALQYLINLQLILGEK